MGRDETGMKSGRNAHCSRIGNYCVFDFENGRGGLPDDAGGVVVLGFANRHFALLPWGNTHHQRGYLPTYVGSCCMKLIMLTRGSSLGSSGKMLQLLMLQHVAHWMTLFLDVDWEWLGIIVSCCAIR